MDLSVVLAFRNASRNIDVQLRALASQQVDCPWELVAVANRTTDDSRQIVESFSDVLPLRLIEASSKVGPAYARNEGARIARGDFLIFLDADDEVGPGFLSAMCRGLREHRFLTGRVDLDRLNQEWVRGAHGPPWHQSQLERVFDFLPAADGCKLGVHRETFASVGGFPEHYGRPSLEDVALSWKIQLAGIPLKLQADAILHYRIPPKHSDLFVQGFKRGFYAPFLYREFRSFGMPRRSLLLAAKGWRRLVVGLLRARDRRTLAEQVHALGFTAGCLVGSFRFRSVFV